MSIIITKGRDKDFTVRLFDQNDDPISIVGWTSIKARFLNSDRSVLELVAPKTAGTNEVQKITFGDVPDEGTFKLTVTDGENTEETAAINFDDVAADVQTALNDLQYLEGVTVSGNSQ
jgi:hypothetical protein